MAFTIKQNDLRPNLPFQLFQADGVTPLNLTAATSVSLAVRSKGGAVKFKKACTLVTPASGLGYYDWADDDTDTAGQFEYEFEILWNDGSPQTVPVDKYLELTIVDDIA